MQVVVGGEVFLMTTLLGILSSNTASTLTQPVWQPGSEQTQFYRLLSGAGEVSHPGIAELMKVPVW